MPKEIFVCIGVHVDAVAGWLGSYGGEDSPCDISRGLFAGEVGAPRLLTLFDRAGVRTTWFVPGHTIETFPRQMKDAAAAGHEIALHGYSHENPLAMTPEQERAVLEKSIALATELAGTPPRGYVAPWWELSAATVGLLLEHGIAYDNSLMNDDFTPFYARSATAGPRSTTPGPAETWMHRWSAARRPTSSRSAPTGTWTTCRRCSSSRAPRTPTASSTRATSNSSGATSSTGSTASWTTPSSR
jgi:peptidoglycan/xylan/chitin deacetylase (PgdA/CDA1 family)